MQNDNSSAGVFMRVIQSAFKRPLNLLAIGTRGHIAAASSEFGVRGDVEVWDLASSKLIFTQTIREREVHGLAFTPDGKYLLVGTNQMLAVLNVLNGEIEPETMQASNFLKFAVAVSKHRLLMVEGWDQHARIAFWELVDGRASQQLWAYERHEHQRFTDPTISIDEGRVAVTATQYFAQGLPKQVVMVLNSFDGTIRLKISNDTNTTSQIEGLQFTVDGSLLLARTLGRIVKVFDATTGQPTRELIHPGRPYVSGMAVHPSGLLACSRNNGTVCFWNVEQRKLVRILDWKLGKLMSVAFSPDGCIGAAGTQDGRVILWDMDE
jgi:WD40 repeat protein